MVSVGGPRHERRSATGRSCAWPPGSAFAGRTAVRLLGIEAPAPGRPEILVPRPAGVSERVERWSAAPGSHLGICSAAPFLSPPHSHLLRSHRNAAPPRRRRNAPPDAARRLFRSGGLHVLRLQRRLRRGRGRRPASHRIRQPKPSPHWRPGFDASGRRRSPTSGGAGSDFDGGRFLARLDCFFPPLLCSARLGIEYDGESHRDRLTEDSPAEPSPARRRPPASLLRARLRERPYRSSPKSGARAGGPAKRAIGAPTGPFER